MSQKWLLLWGSRETGKFRLFLVVPHLSSHV